MTSTQNMKKKWRLLTVRLKGVADKQIPPINLAASGLDGASIHHDGGPVESGHS